MQPSFAALIDLTAFAEFIGYQETPDCAPWWGRPIALWNLSVPLPGLLVNSTYAESTLRSALDAMRARKLESDACAAFGRDLGESLERGMRSQGCAGS